MASKSKIFFVMEYVKGGELSTRWPRAGLRGRCRRLGKTGFFIPFVGLRRMYRGGLSRKGMMRRRLTFGCGGDTVVLMVAIAVSDQNIMAIVDGCENDDIDSLSSESVSESESEVCLEGSDEGARFVSGSSFNIISKLEEIAKVVRFAVRKKDCRVSLEGPRDGAKGPLTIAAEILITVFESR
ncbi:UNVERIFIED_CONTAM: CBL-interacting serine/threonine-protein kinase [Sesamum latifolium]|uniref:CBL-interacting serine/threonine-protein kinase n=1 Tax=Sesamum latifolium TaxID=2727402 RepID=A0AAW2TT89_9LAMI